MSIRSETRTWTYCDGGPHPGNFREAWLSVAAFKAWLRGQGWTVVGDQTYCPEHKPSRKR